MTRSFILVLILAQKKWQKSGFALFSSQKHYEWVDAVWAWQKQISVTKTNKRDIKNETDLYFVPILLKIGHFFILALLSSQKHYEWVDAVWAWQKQISVTKTNKRDIKNETDLYFVPILLKIGHFFILALLSSQKHYEWVDAVCFGAAVAAYFV